MKKVWYSLLGVAVIFGSLSFVVRAAEKSTSSPANRGTVASERQIQPNKPMKQLEKIPNPAAIKNFENIQKVGTSLWGTRRETTTTEKTKTVNGEARKTTSSETKKTEVKRTETSKAPQPQPKPKLKIQPAAAACVKTAIEKKDTTLKTALTTYQISLLTAIDTRTACQKVAIDGATAAEQQAANKECTDDYTHTVWDNLATLKTAKEQGWKTFRDDLKLCQTMQGTDNQNGEILVEDGEMQINLQINPEEEPKQTDAHDIMAENMNKEEQPK